jgi:hypothetical protein
MTQPVKDEAAQKAMFMSWFEEAMDKWLEKETKRRTEASPPKTSDSLFGKLFS